MFDFRYHIASLAAVFLALVVGIVIGVGLSGQGVAKESERELLNEQLDLYKARLDAARTRIERQEAAERFVDAAYQAVLDGRLAGRRMVVVFVGPSQQTPRSAIARAIEDAGAAIDRLLVLKVPVDDAALASTLDSQPELAALASPDDPREIGRALGRELVTGGETPLLDAVAGQLVIERNPDGDDPADGIVVVRTAQPQLGATARFLNGLYSGLAGSLPAVWIETATDENAAGAPSGFASVREVQTAIGRVALAVLLGSGAQGEYGPGAETVVPPIEPVTPPATAGG